VNIKNASKTDAAPSGGDAFLQRCACKKPAGPGGESPESKDKRASGPALQRKTGQVSDARGLSADVAPIGRVPRFNYDINRVSVHPQAASSRLSIGAPGDRYEQEAEQVAERVSRMPDPMTGAKPETRQTTPEINLHHGTSVKRVQRDLQSPYSIADGIDSTKPGQNPDQDQGTVQTQEQPGQTPQLTREFEKQIGALQGGGQPLTGPVRSSMESRFGHDFSRVQIHTEHPAAALAASINARAFTLGRDVVFGAGQYVPGSEAGQRLIAHELTHSIQQGQAPRLDPSKQEVSAPGSGGETETKPSSLAPPSPVLGISAAPAVARTIQCVRWNPNVDTGKKVKPWGTGPDGRILTASTDAGTPLSIWKPDDGRTYWCHGFTFGGNTATGGPYSFWGSDVPTVLSDEGWKSQDACASKPGDILVFTGGNPITHSGIITSAVNSSGGVDEDGGMLNSKWGEGAQNTSSVLANSDYGQYQSYSKKPVYGACKYRGIHEGGSSLPLPPGDYPQQQQKNTAVA
jgi:hypothetical protein